MRKTRGQIHNRLENIMHKTEKELLEEKEEVKKEVKALYGGV